MRVYWTTLQKSTHSKEIGLIFWGNMVKRKTTKVQKTSVCLWFFLV